MPAAEVPVTRGLVAQLLRRQHPDLAGLRLRPAAAGWDNVVYRLGDELAVRVPRRALGADLLAHELRWMPVLAPRLPLPIPVPVRRGEPDAGYPWPWAISRWVPGSVATRARARDPEDVAHALADFLLALHQPADPRAPVNRLRGGPIASRVPSVAEAAARVAEHIQPGVRRAWDVALAAPPHPGPPVWIHGDLHPANLVLRRGRLAGVIDFGDLTSGDPACDFACAWLLLDAGHHGPLREAAQSHGPGTWERATGWAVALALLIVANSADHPRLADVGRRALARLG